MTIATKLAGTAYTVLSATTLLVEGQRAEEARGEDEYAEQVTYQRVACPVRGCEH
jgi:hypothetical protein